MELRKMFFSRDRRTNSRQSSPGLNSLARQITPLAKWDDLILPDQQKATLKQVVLQMRHQKKVYTDWGFASKYSRKFGISVLFYGESGTGKTMASEALAKELHLDLYRVDLSQIVNKYIGETEKNLKRIFDAAEDGGAILLFDEADALFGKRNEVNDSHDRYANIEIYHFLQLMEDYKGLTILTANKKTAIDEAFIRRMRFVVLFPIPDAAQREEIWKRIFPKETPVESIDEKKLAKFPITGGNIRNIALNAAFIAADKEVPVNMSHILQAAKMEFAETDKPLCNIDK